MNRKQRLVLIVGCIAVLMLTLFPPWVYQFKIDDSLIKIPGVHAFVFAPPSQGDAIRTLGVGLPFYLTSVWLDGPRLAGEFAGVVLATTGLVLAFWRRPDEG